MRKLTDFHDQTTARSLGDYLLANGVSNQVDQDGDTAWSVWVHEDDHMEQAREHLEFFRANPTHADVRKAVNKANERRAQILREQKETRSTPVDVRTHWHKESMKPMLVTMAIIAISVVVYVVQSFVPRGGEFTHWLFISENSGAMPLAYTLLYVLRNKLTFGQAFSGNYWFAEIMHGQIWRLFTPIFLHFGILHIFFNMSWIAFLGPMIERRKGAFILLAQVLVVALVSNVLQYVFHGPRFGGMSGVVCGLFGYAWMMGRYNSGEGISIDKNTVIYFVAFLIIALFGMLGPIANTAHFAGLFTGMIWGYADSGRLRWKWRRITQG